jgi:hypothetical protein
MATEQVGESRDVGPLLRGERQGFEMISAGAPLAAAPDGQFQRISPRSGFISAVFLVNGSGKRLTQAAGQLLPDEWHRPICVFSDIDDQVLPYRREPARARGDAAGLLTPTVTR